MKPWGFYGRAAQLEDLERVLRRNRWFFVKVTGRRRIGKTTLIQRALEAVSPNRQTFYVQIPDSEPAGVLSAVSDALDTFGVPADRFPRPRDMARLAKTLEAMADAGYVVVLDEFQYFNRKPYVEFCSLLQAAVDRLSAKADRVKGGWLVLGSVHTEMEALLDDRGAPLYNRVTDPLDLTHLSAGSVAAIIREHADVSPARLLFLWSLFEGVPKYYRDCHEQGVLGSTRDAVLRRMFFQSSSPLRTEAENWFLRELRGRYDVVLKTVARMPGRTQGELTQAIRDAGDTPDVRITAYLSTLADKYRLIERKLPVFAKPDERRGRYYLTDNFLRSWLAGLAGPVSAVSFRALDQLVSEADQKLADVEGNALEKLAGQLYEERSRLGVGDFPLTSRICGYWDKQDTEIDLVAVNEDDRVIRFGSCKRSPAKLTAGVNDFRGHVERFLDAKPKYQNWRVEYVGIAPELSPESRGVLERHEVIPQDLNDLLAGVV